MNKRKPTAERPLVMQAVEAMRANGRVPELPVLRLMTDERLRELIAHWSGPYYVA